ncbi:MAG: hypothetical protein LQ337_005850 [Flavoplaca oasis]|nr:MAG: hypothetical protein LQ337_005850 [Flavoplaca oasis]
MPFNPAKDIPDLSGKVIFITGGWWHLFTLTWSPGRTYPTTGTSGIGKAAVLALAAFNPTRIYFTGRNSAAGAAIIAEAQKLHPSLSSISSSLIFIQCDLASSRESIRSALANKFDSSRLDIFIANAGMMAVPEGLTAEGFEVQFGTNYFGHAVILRLLRPLMLRTAQEGSQVRFVAVSSFGHTMAPPSGIEFDRLRMPDAGTKWHRYGQSKLADILLAKSMAKRYPEIKSVSVHPGLVRTELGGRAEKSPFLMMMELLRWTPLYKSPEKGAHNLLWAATTANWEGGKYYEPVGK